MWLNINKGTPYHNNVKASQQAIAGNGWLAFILLQYIVHTHVHYETYYCEMEE